MDNGNRDIWVDNVKVVACILVVLGHFFQSIVKAGLVPANDLLIWFDNTIYYFHVPLFFICSGFLYQKYSNINTFTAWKNSILKKSLALGIPYFIFSITTWLLKTLFISSVNDPPGKLSYNLFIHPISPYWYLYILYILFFITITTKNIHQQIILIILALFLKILNSCGVITGVYCVDKTMENWIWFVTGMTLAYNSVKYANIYIGTILFILFLTGSTLVQVEIIPSGLFNIILSVIACYSVISIVYTYSQRSKQKEQWMYSKYTTPVFLMHTLFSASFRAILLKMGIDNLFIHIMSGLTISFLGPVIAMYLLERFKPLDFIIYPTRYIKPGKNVDCTINKNL